MIQRGAYRSLAGLCLTMGLGLMLAGGCTQVRPLADAEDLKAFPLPANIPGDPPKSGLRYWAKPFQRLNYTVRKDGNSYVSVIQPPAGGFEFWANDWDEGDVSRRTVFVRRGPSLDKLGEPEVAFDSGLINDVPDMAKPGQLAPERGFTRTTMLLDPQEGYVLMTCVCPAYKPGSVPLLPALVVSKTGAPGTWKYLGKLPGEPLAEAKKAWDTAKRHIWSDGGPILRLADGRWRIYLNGFGQKLTAVESDTLAGPWTFLRDEKGAIRELLPDLPVGGIWANVLRLGEADWHLWLTDTWPPQSIWHYRSTDGLTWTRFGKQPEITRATVGQKPIKCLRTYYDPAHDEIVGLLAVWDTRPGGGKCWCPYTSRMPAHRAP